MIPVIFDSVNVVIQIILDFIYFNFSFLRVFQAILVIISGIILRKIFAKVVFKFIKNLAQKTTTDIDDIFVKVVEKPSGYLIICIGLAISIKFFHFNKILENSLIHITNSMVILCIFWLLHDITDVAAKLMLKIAKKTETQYDDIIVNFTKKVIKIFIIIIAISIIIKEWGYDITGIIAGLGLGGLALALAAKDTAENLFGSITLMLDKPFSKEDWIMTPKVEGRVIEIGFRSTRIRTFSQAIVTIPNSIMNKETITNWSKMGKRRVSFRIQIEAITKKNEIENFISKIKSKLMENDDVDKEQIIVCFDGFNEGRIEILIYYFTIFIDFENYLKAKEKVNYDINSLLLTEKIGLACPIKKLYIDNFENNYKEKVYD